MRNISMLVLLITFLFSCKSEMDSRIKHVSENTINKIDFQKGSPILQHEFGILQLFSIDSFLILRKRKSEFIFSIYNKHNLQLLGNIGKSGQGPEEFLAPYYCGQNQIDSTGIKFWVNDIHKKTLSLLNVSSSLAQNQTVIEKKVKLNDQLVTPRHSFYINENSILGVSEGVVGRLFMYNPQTQAVQFSNLFPHLNIPPTSKLIDFSSLYIDNCEIAPDNSKVVSAMKYFNRIDIFNDTGNREVSIIVNEGNSDEILHYNSIIEGTITCYFEDLYVTDNHIYALYINQQDKDVADVEKPVDIYKFDYSGNLLKIFAIPNYVLQFIVDEEQSKLYAVNYISDKELKVYDIPI